MRTCSSTRVPKYCVRKTWGLGVIRIKGKVERAHAARAARITPMTPSQFARRPKLHPQRCPGGRYTTMGYARAIAYPDISSTTRTGSRMRSSPSVRSAEWFPQDSSCGTNLWSASSGGFRAKEGLRSWSRRSVALGHTTPCVFRGIVGPVVREGGFVPPVLTTQPSPLGTMHVFPSQSWCSGVFLRPRTNRSSQNTYTECGQEIAKLKAESVDSMAEYCMLAEEEPIHGQR